jgi:hypothetical protein
LLDDSRRNFKLAMELLNLTFAESSVDKLVRALLEFYNYHGTHSVFAAIHPHIVMCARLKLRLNVRRDLCAVLRQSDQLLADGH